MSQRPPATILVVDDDPQSLESTARILAQEGFAVETAGEGEAALARLRPGGDAAPDLVVTDLRMPRMDGMELLKAVALVRPEMPVLLMTAFGRVEDAVGAMKLGAVDFLMKPFRRKDLLGAVSAALRRSRPSHVQDARGELLGRTEPMIRLRALCDQVAATEATVLISGESGTGKERVARRIHGGSPRARGPFVALNCAALPETLIESELFGYERGAFSGATSAKPGLFEAAEGGTLFLDEIGDLPLLVQAKLLRALQEREIRRLGATQSRKVDVRVVSATHRDLRAAAAEGRFREDLLFRLEVIAIAVPPLRERAEDIPLLAAQFLREAAERHRLPEPSLASAALDCLKRHTWPGNVRELSNALERAVVLCVGGEIDVDLLPRPLVESVGGGARGSVVVPFGTPLREVEELLIRKTLEATDGDKNMTARLLGINSRTIYRKLERRAEPGLEDAPPPPTPPGGPEPG
ncbi:MAG: sigma-54-dependent Fis family transcriptional regulator [Bdellovibrionales bacterium]|nr:sigma-54-dependent Fis family transcriptional regulator [Bdellovibrionales bacterium]